MKRFLLVLLTLLLLASSASAEAHLRGWAEAKHYQFVVFGQYPYERDGSLRPVAWRVLEVREDGYALIMADRVLDAYPYIVVDKKVDLKEYRDYPPIMTYEESDLYTWINTEMADTLFTPAEQAVLDQERGKLFPLTTEEFLVVEWGFSPSIFGVTQKRVASATPYANKHGAYLQDDGSTYWTASLRFPGAEGHQAQIVGYDGHMSFAGYGRGNVGIRPCALVDTARLNVLSGDGTKRDPLILVPAE